MNLNYLIYFIVFAILAFVILVTFRTLGKVKKFKDNNETITEKNLKNKSEVSGKIIDETFNSGIKLEFLKIEAKEMQFLYDDGNSHVFMDNITYDQFNVSNNKVEKSKNYLKSGANVDLLFDGDEVLDIRLPSHVILKVEDTEPGVKGNTATGATKPATVETNYTLQVPLFIDEGEQIKIDTRSGEYIERVKS